MSKGIGANANLIHQDETLIIYEYGGYDDNVIERRKEKNICDGRITLNKRCFDEYTTRYDISKMLVKGLIKVENCSNCWSITNDNLKIDMMALPVLSQLFTIYQNSGEIPKRIFYYV